MKAQTLFVLFQVLRALQANPIAKNITQFNEVDEVDLTWRLPKTIYPKSYQIELETKVHDHGDLDYKGTVIFFLDVHVPTNKIFFHSIGLNILEVLLFDGFTTVDGIIYYADETREFLIIEARDDFEPGSDLMLFIEFTGQLRLQGVGFYRSEYKVDGETRYLATTQFEAAYARYAFPVFDGIYEIFHGKFHTKSEQTNLQSPGIRRRSS
jgi:aminopeptidase N